jgi:hypothetical protein
MAFRLVLLALGLVLCAGCDGKGSAQGSGTGSSARGRAGISLPF